MTSGGTETSSAGCESPFRYTSLREPLEEPPLCACLLEVAFFPPPCLLLPGLLLLFALPLPAPFLFCAPPAALPLCVPPLFSLALALPLLQEA